MKSSSPTTRKAVVNTLKPTSNIYFEFRSRKIKTHPGEDAFFR